MKTTRDLLFEQEIKGLKFIFYFRLFFASGTLFITLGSAQSLAEIYLTSSFMVLALLFSLFTIHFLLNKNKLIKTSGILGALIDLVILMILVFVWYYSVGGEKVPRTYLLKSHSLLALQFVILIINSFAAKPLYPLIITFGTLLSNAGLLAYSWCDISSSLSPAFEDHLLSPKFSISYYIMINITYLLTGIIISYYTGKNGKMVAESIIQASKNKQLSRYFSPNIIHEFNSMDSDLTQAAGKKQEVAVMFCDLRNFTSLSENSKPEDVVEMLKEYYDKMVSVIFKHGGTLDKFIGDAIMATFGTPYTKEDDAKRAVLCAVEIKLELKNLNIERKLKGSQPLENGIGLHYGEVIVGNIGSKDRLEYTVIGDTVNTASRIEGICKKTGKGLLFSEDVYKHIEGLDISSVSVGTFKLKGRENPIKLYSAE